MPITQKKTKSSRGQIDIRTIKNDVLILPRRQYRALLEVSAINFGLKSQAEKDAIILSYGEFLNSLSMPLQILVRVRELSMDTYLSKLDSLKNAESEEIYRTQILNYREFVLSLVEDNKVLTRRFYIVLPYTGKPTKDESMIREKLSLNVDIVLKGLARIDITGKRLNSLEIADLFYEYCSPTAASIKPLSVQALAQVTEGVL